MEADGDDEVTTGKDDDGNEGSDFDTAEVHDLSITFPVAVPVAVFRQTSGPTELESTFVDFTKKPSLELFVIMLTVASLLVHFTIGDVPTFCIPLTDEVTVGLFRAATDVEVDDCFLSAAADGDDDVAGDLLFTGTTGTDDGGNEGSDFDTAEVHDLSRIFPVAVPIAVCRQTSTPTELESTFVDFTKKPSLELFVIMLTVASLLVHFTIGDVPTFCILVTDEVTAGLFRAATDVVVDDCFLSAAADGDDDVAADLLFTGTTGTDDGGGEDSDFGTAEERRFVVHDMSIAFLVSVSIAVFWQISESTELESTFVDATKRSSLEAYVTVLAVTISVVTVASGVFLTAIAG